MTTPEHDIVAAWRAAAKAENERVEAWRAAGGQDRLDRDGSMSGFMWEVKQARENGFDLVCAFCGAGISDDSDDHAIGCVHERDRSY